MRDLAPCDGRIAEIEHTVRFLMMPGSVMELRILNTRCGTVSGYFDDPGKLARVAVRWDGRAPGIYVTINPVRRDLLARAANRLHAHARHTTSDVDVLCRHWLPLDFDPVRPAGISSSNSEHQAALERARLVRDEMRKRGWPDPVLASSGNGAHLLYPLDLPNDVQTHEWVRYCLQALSFEFSDEQVHLDTANHNAARIWKLYGTLACKGDATEERPHRLARVLECPWLPDAAPFATEEKGAGHA